MEQNGEDIVFYASPGIGHLKPMVELAELIVTNHPSFSITILLTCLPGMPKSAFDPLIASAAPSIAFRHLPSLMTKDTASIVELYFEIPRLSRPDIRSLLEGSKIKAFVMHLFCNAAFEVSTSLGIDTYFFGSSGGAALAGFLYLPEVLRVVGDSRDPNIVINVPGLPPFPFSLYKLYCTEGELADLFLSTAINMANSRGIITRTFRELEERTLRAVSNGQTPPVYCIGPLIGENLRTPGAHGKEELDCLTWLDSQPKKSVIFLCFGRMGVFSGKQLKEMATGLENSGHRFLWVVRDPPKNEEEELFPIGFLERTKGRGLVVKNWAPRKAVLSHNSVGGFVTHCGWNSVLEAVCAGVPMVTWPLYAEQEFNREGMVDEMSVALRLNESEEGFVSAVELEKRVTELMDPDFARGREVRERVGAMKEAAVATMADGGSSRLELAQFIGSLK